MAKSSTNTRRRRGARAGLARAGRCAGVLLAATAVAAVATAADLYRWTDADGVPQFSDTPPPPDIYRAADAVTVGEWLAVQEEAERRARREAMREAIEAALAPPPGPAPSSEPPERVESPYDCEEARNILAAQRRPGTRLFSMDEDGRFVRSTPEQVQAVIAEWEQAVQTLCREDIELVRPGAATASARGEAGEQP